jgi:hypothetical protein
VVAGLCATACALAIAAQAAPAPAPAVGSPESRAPAAIILAQAEPKAKWTGPAAPKAEAPPPPAAPAAEADAAAAAAAPPAETPATGPLMVVDDSAALLAIDRALSDRIFDDGPLAGYGATLSSEGVLHDANGASPMGAAGVQARFATFPADVKLERKPEKAMASETSGATWGGYTITRAGATMSTGRYITVWRREPVGWRIVSELVAGRATPQAAPAPTGLRTPADAPVALPRPAPAPPLRDALGRPATGTPPAPKAAPAGR